MRAGPAAGIVVMLFAMTLLPIMDAVSKLLTSHYGPIQITWVRNVVHIALVAPIALALHGKNALHTPSMVLQIARCLLMTLMAILYVQALSSYFDLFNRNNPRLRPCQSGSRRGVQP